MSEEKLCFVICPIGKDDSEIRQHSDNVFNHIIKPAVEPLGYTAKRADQSPNPGIITEDIIKDLQEADLVIADLSFGNPNVFYELAIRHVTQLPVIQIIRICDEIPFDLIQMRSIIFDLSDPSTQLSEATKSQKAIQGQISVDPDTVPSNPLTSALNNLALRGSTNPSDKTLANILDLLKKISAIVAQHYLSAYLDDPAPGLSSDLRMQKIELFLDTLMAPDPDD